MNTIEDQCLIKSNNTYDTLFHFNCTNNYINSFYLHERETYFQILFNLAVILPICLLYFWRTKIISILKKNTLSDHLPQNIFSISIFNIELVWKHAYIQSQQDKD